jgi:hypothetical protein
MADSGNDQSWVTQNQLKSEIRSEMNAAIVSLTQAMRELVAPQNPPTPTYQPYPVQFQQPASPEPPKPPDQSRKRHSKKEFAPASTVISSILKRKPRIR